MANISARERRRLKLRQSQNESNSNPSDGRPPLVLRRLDRKPNMEAQHKSEIFYNSENKKGNDHRGVSKSYNEDHINQHGLKDSLKIFRQNNPAPAARDDSANQRNNFRGSPQTETAEKPKPIFNRVQSSSSSSVDSSGDDDQGNQLVRLQKQKEK